MFGTGEFWSSLRESTIPSWTSSAWTVGTYCRQIGSSGDLMRSTMAGEMRNSKFSAAWRSRSISGKCSAPNRAAKASSEAMLFLRSSSCQDSMRQILEIDHQVVTGRVVPRELRGPGEAASYVEAPRGRVVRAGGRLGDQQPETVGHEPLLHVGQELAADAGPLPGPVHHDPVQIRCAFRPRRGAPAGEAGQLVALIRADEAIVVVAGQGFVQELHRRRHLGRPEQTGGRDQRLKPPAVRGTDGSERAAHARPSPPAPRAAPPRRCGAPARRIPTRAPGPCATGR